MINVLVVEDSRVVRDYLVFLLENDPALHVMDTAESGEAALECVARRQPDVILMDIHMPGIDGLETTRRIMESTPIPIVVCTASTSFNEVHTAMHALEAGALAVLKKPEGFGAPSADADAAAIVTTLKLMSEVTVVRRWRNRRATNTQPAPVTAERRAAEPRTAVVAIGASTGGPAAVLKILSQLPPTFPLPILIVQHITVGFTQGYAEWLSSASALPVHVAENGTLPLPGHVYIAPDERHLRVGPRGELQTSSDAPHRNLRPSVGVLFRSVAARHGRQAIGVLLTGMGRDGAEELKLMAEQGALTIAQDEQSCVVFGMPGEAVKLGAAQHVLPLQEIAKLLVSAVTRQGGVDD